MRRWPRVLCTKRVMRRVVAGSVRKTGEAVGSHGWSQVKEAGDVVGGQGGVYVVPKRKGQGRVVGAGDGAHRSPRSVVTWNARQRGVRLVVEGGVRDWAWWGQPELTHLGVMWQSRAGGCVYPLVVVRGLAVDGWCALSPSSPPRPSLVLVVGDWVGR